MIWLLIGYMWLFVHRPFEIWPVLGSLHIERMYMILVIVYWLTSSPRFVMGNRLHFAFTLFLFAMFTSWLLSPYQHEGDGTIAGYLKYVVFYVLLVTSVRNEGDLRGILVGYLGAMMVFMLHSLWEYWCGRAWMAQGIVRMRAVGATFDYNDLAGLIVCSLPFLWALWPDWRSLGRRLLLLAYLGVAFSCILLTGSRMGACGLILAGGLACWMSPNRWRLLAMSPVLLAVAFLMLPEDRVNRYLTLVDSSRGPANATSSAANWRLEGLQAALPLFEERPLVGFGPMSFGRATGKGLMPHNLYGQILAELGLAGAVAFAAILFCVAKNQREARNIVQFATFDRFDFSRRMVGACSGAFILLAAMAWGFNFLYWHVWLWFSGFQVVALCHLKQEYFSLVVFDSQHMSETSESWEMSSR